MASAALKSASRRSPHVFSCVLPPVSYRVEHHASPSHSSFYYEGEVAVAERLAVIAPMSGSCRVAFGNSGAEAIEAAFKLARHHTGRPHVIAFYGAFHGRTLGALSLTASKPVQRRGFLPLVPEVTHVEYPFCYPGVQARSDCFLLRLTP